MARQFTDILRELAGGQCVDELTARLAELVDAVVATRKVGRLTLTLKVRPNSDQSVFIAETIKSAVPEEPRGDTVFFTTSGGGLHRSDPRQNDMFPKEVKPVDGPMKEVVNA